jgi:hypothetical protein
MKQSSLIRMKKEGEYWRVDADSYPDFIAYLKHYFTEDDSFRITVPYNILYADIDSEGICMISPLFGAVRMDRNRMVIEGVSPDRYVVAWADSLTLRLCVGTSSCKHFFMLRLKMKSNR